MSNFKKLLRRIPHREPPPPPRPMHNITGTRSGHDMRFHPDLVDPKRAEIEAVLGRPIEDGEDIPWPVLWAAFNFPYPGGDMITWYMTEDCRLTIIPVMSHVWKSIMICRAQRGAL